MGSLINFSCQKDLRRRVPKHKEVLDVYRAHGEALIAKLVSVMPRGWDLLQHHLQSVYGRAAEVRTRPRVAPRPNPRRAIDRRRPQATPTHPDRPILFRFPVFLLVRRVSITPSPVAEAFAPRRVLPHPSPVAFLVSFFVSLSLPFANRW